jgi:hypothetical protein
MIFGARLGQELKVPPVVLLVGEYLLAVVASLGDMVRKIDSDNSGSARHWLFYPKYAILSR